MLVENPVVRSAKVTSLRFRKMFFDQAIDRQVSQDITAVNDKNFVSDLLLDVFDASTGLQQIWFIAPVREVPRCIRSRETARKISPANGEN